MHYSILRLKPLDMDQRLQRSVRCLQNRDYKLCNTLFPGLLTPVDHSLRLFGLRSRCNPVSGVHGHVRQCYSSANSIRITQVLRRRHQLGHVQTRSLRSLLCSDTVLILLTWQTVRHRDRSPQPSLDRIEFSSHCHSLASTVAELRIRYQTHTWKAEHGRRLAVANVPYTRFSSHSYHRLPAFKRNVCCSPR